MKGEDIQSRVSVEVPPKLASFSKNSLGALLAPSAAVVGSGLVSEKVLFDPQERLQPSGDFPLSEPLQNVAHNSQSTPHAPLSARSVVVPLVHHILATRLPNEPRTIEVSLSPKELGNLRIRMTPGETGLMIHVNADRIETLDLLRRNIDLLQKELDTAGYPASGFSFGGDPGRGRPAYERSEGNYGVQHESSEDDHVANSHTPQRGQSGGLDLRL